MSYRIDPHRPLTQEICRIGSGQIHEAIALLDEGRTKRDGGAHEARKRFKRLRGLLRLIAEAAPGFRRREEHRIKEIAASLSAIRDATAIIETIDRFADEAKTPDDIDRLMTLRRGLQARLFPALSVRRAWSGFPDVCRDKRRTDQCWLRENRRRWRRRNAARSQDPDTIFRSGEG